MLLRVLLCKLVSFAIIIIINILLFSRGIVSSRLSFVGVDIGKSYNNF